ncbi:hypothetical protein L195_g061046, partial [Trifolium pratense]
GDGCVTFGVVVRAPVPNGRMSDPFPYRSWAHDIVITHLGWSGGIGLRPGSLLLLKVSGSILSGAKLGRLI